MNYFYDHDLTKCFKKDDELTIKTSETHKEMTHHRQELADAITSQGNNLK